ncbi:hypothetical protein NA56DRAFT_552365, partial [Hyaloscypha hepaticicola]
FSTNCTLPTKTTTIVSGANIRGTFDILWSGLFTIFICIWTVQHLNVPEQRKGRDPGWRGDLKWAWKGFFTKFKWMLFTLILPEFLFAKACAERIVAHESMKDVRNMKAEGQRSEAESSNWTAAHAFYAEMGGFVIHPHGEGTTDTRVVATIDIVEFRKRGFLRTLPTITADHLNDLSNGDSFTKIAAVGQVTWMVVQVIVRAVNRIPITQLEVTACGSAALTFLTYLLWWDKPQAVSSVTELPLSEDAPDFESLVESLQDRTFCINDMVLVSGELPRKLEDNEPMPQQTISGHGNTDILFVLGFVLGGIILGCVESSAWKFDFPTSIELLLWRISSLVIIAAFPLLYTIILIIELAFPKTRMASEERVLQVASFITFPIFFFARLFILFETIYSLFHLPPGVFISTWSSSVPHL